MIAYRPLIGPIRLQRACAATGQNFRIVKPIKRQDENGDIYDLTRAFVEGRAWRDGAADASRYRQRSRRMIGLLASTACDG